MIRLLLITQALLLALALDGQPLKQSFGQNGKLRLQLDDYTETADLVTDHDSLLLLTYSGHSGASWYDMNVSLTKLDPQGNPVAHFGQNGTATFDFDGMDYSTARELAICPDGKILVMGSGYAISNPAALPLCLMRLQANGQIDSSFGINGTAKISLCGISEFPGSMLFDSNDKIMLTGGTYDTLGMHNIPFIARCYDDATADSGFAETGREVIDFVQGFQSIRTGPGFSPQHLTGGEAYTMVMLPGNEMLVGGSCGPDCFLLRLKENGSPDSAFAGLGYSVFRVDPVYNNRVDKLALLNDGTALAAITVEKTTGRDYELLRFSPADGSTINSGFVDFSFYNDWLSDLQVIPTGGFVTAGRTIIPVHATTPGYRSDFFAISIVNDPQQLMQQQQVLIAFDSSYQSGAQAVAVQSDGTVIAAGFTFESTPGYADAALMAIDPTLLSVHNDLVSHELQAAPNPAVDYIVVQFPDEGGSWQMYDAAGRLVREEQNISAQETIDLKNLSPGYYLLSWKNEKLQLTNKIVKLR